MSGRFSVSVTPGVIENHMAAYMIVTEILRNQSQPIHVTESVNGGLVFDLRVNLSRQQCERLIIREIEQNLLGYSCSIDWDTNRMVIEREAAKRARKIGRKEPVGIDEQASAGGRVGGAEI